MGKVLEGSKKRNFWNWLPSDIVDIFFFFFFLKKMHTFKFWYSFDIIFFILPILERQKK